MVWPAIIAALGGIIGAGIKSHSTSQATRSAERQKMGELDLQRQAMELGFFGQQEENQRRQAEAAFRAAKLEDVAKMFESLEGMSDMRGLASQLQNFEMGMGDQVDMRKSAMRELGMNSEALNAMLAQSGVMGSGFGATQQRGLMTDTMMGLSRDIAQHNLQRAGMRQQGLLGAANVMGQMGQLDLSRKGSMASLLSDPAFGVNAPYSPPGEDEIAEWRRLLELYLGEGSGASPAGPTRPDLTQYGMFR